MGGLLGDAEGLLKDSGQEQNLTNEAEQFANNATGDHFSSEIDQAGQQLDNSLGGQDQNQQ